MQHAACTLSYMFLVYASLVGHFIRKVFFKCFCAFGKYTRVQSTHIYTTGPIHSHEERQACLWLHGCGVRRLLFGNRYVCVCVCVYAHIFMYGYVRVRWEDNYLTTGVLEMWRQIHEPSVFVCVFFFVCVCMHVWVYVHRCEARAYVYAFMCIHMQHLCTYNTCSCYMCIHIQY